MKTTDARICLAWENLINGTLGKGSVDVMSAGGDDVLTIAKVVANIILFATDNDLDDAEAGSADRFNMIDRYGFHVTVQTEEDEPDKVYIYASVCDAEGEDSWLDVSCEGTALNEVVLEWQGRAPRYYEGGEIK